MSDINKKSYASRLRSNEMSKCHSQNKSNFNFGSQMVALESSNDQKKNTNQQREIFAEPNRIKYGGRGMAIRELCASMESSNLHLMRLNLDFSNSSIESYFKKRREENLKKLEDENTKAYNDLIHSHKKT